MQSPPASAEATSVIILHRPVLARPGASSQVQALLYQLRKDARICRAKVAGRSYGPSIGQWTRR